MKITAVKPQVVCEGGRTRDKVVCYPHNGGPGIDRLVESCRRTASEGWKFVRWGLSDADSEEEFEPVPAVRFGIVQVEAVRDALGDEVEILVKVHTRLDPADSIAFCQGSQDFARSSSRTRSEAKMWGVSSFSGHRLPFPWQ